MAANADHPNQMVENSYVPPPWAVGHSIFGLFILEGQQIDLHFKTPFWPCGSVAFSWQSHYSWMLGTLMASLIGTPTPRRGWTTRGVSRKLWPSFPSALPPTLTSKLRMSIPLLRPAINCITLSHLPFESICFQAPHPLFNILCSSGGPHYLQHSMRTSWPYCLSFLFLNSFHNGLVTFLYSLMVASSWLALLAQLMGPIKLNPTSLAFPKGCPSLHDCHPRIRTASPGASTTVW